MRSRLYLRHPKSEDAEAIKDRRVIEVKKSNYGPSSNTVPLMYQNGRFMLDANPIIEGAKPAKTPKVDTALALAVMRLFETATAGQVLAHGSILKGLQGNAALGPGNDETVRKRVQRTVGQLCKEGLLMACQIPRGSYRLPPPTEGAS